MTTEITGPLYEYLQVLDDFNDTLTAIIFNPNTTSMDVLERGIMATSTSIQIWPDGDFSIIIIAPDYLDDLENVEATLSSYIEVAYYSHNSVGPFDMRFIMKLDAIKKDWTERIKRIYG